MLNRGVIWLADAAGIDLGKSYLRKADGRYVMWHAEAFPGATNKGPRCALRSRVIWWLYTGEVLKGYDVNLHHKNHDRTDDRFENLEKITHAEHSLLHNPDGRSDVERTCRECGRSFTIDRGRLSEKGRGSFCSSECYHKHPRKTKREEILCHFCGTAVLLTPYRAAFRRFCSHRCSASYRWANT